MSADEFWSVLKRCIFPLRPSQYDITSICNLSCEGCLFFSGSDNDGRVDVKDRSVIDAFLAREAARGTRYGYFGGAEPSLAEDTLVAAARHIPYGVVFTNGIRRLSREIPYRVHVSVWGLEDRSRELRGADVLRRQIKNYAGDRRAVFVFTISSRTIGDLPRVAHLCAEAGLALTFNHYSPTTRYLEFLAGQAKPDRFHSRQEKDDLRLSSSDVHRSKHMISDLMDRYPRQIIYNSDFNDRIHDPAGLYPELDPATGVAIDCGVRLTSSLRHYNTDLTASSAKCCSPNVDCRTCRLYAQSLATLLSRGTRQFRNAEDKITTIELWRLWCALFLNDDRLPTWSDRSEGREVRHYAGSDSPARWTQSPRAANNQMLVG